MRGKSAEWLCPCASCSKKRSSPVPGFTAPGISAVYERRSIYPPSAEPKAARLSGIWSMLVLCAGLIALAITSGLCGIRYYASYCASDASPQKRAQRMEFICSRASEYKP